MYNNNNHKSNTLRACAMMLGMDAQDLATLLNIYESEKKRTKSGLPSSLLNWVGEERRKAEVYNANAERSGRHSGVSAEGHSGDAYKRPTPRLDHLID